MITIIYKSLNKLYDKYLQNTWPSKSNNILTKERGKFFNHKDLEVGTARAWHVSTTTNPIII